MDLNRILSNQKAEVENFDPSALISRVEEKDINLNSKLAQVVIGVRRSGKSTICQKVLAESGLRYGYVNFDDENLSELTKSDFDRLMESLYRIYGAFSHLFLDEIQNIAGWELFVNRLLRQGMHLVITGSNANLLSGDLATHLTGRYNEIRLYPFSYSEYCDVKGVDVKGNSTKSVALRLKALDEYIIKGGFPETINEVDSRLYANRLLQSIVTKDICKRYEVKYAATLKQMTDGILDRYCQEVSFTSLSEEYSIRSVHTVKSYFSYLSNAFLVCVVPKLSFKSRERQLSRKCYAIDNSFISGHDNALSTEGYGWRLENVIAVELSRWASRRLYDVYYIKKTNDYEIDFAIVERGRVLELIQVTYSFRNPSVKLYNREVGGLVKAGRQFNCDKLTLISMECEVGIIEKDGFSINVCNAVDWLLARG